MMSRRSNLDLAAMVMALVVAAGTATTVSQGVTRDTPAQQRDKATAASGRIAGRVLGADNGRPVSRALVRLTAPELPGGRSALTDNSGAFEFTELPTGRYTLAASKAGYVGLSFGQRRPLQAGTPLQLSEGQELKGVDFRLPRGSAITGHVYDENGDPFPGAAVRVGRYQYGQGMRQLVPAGTAQTDDRGEYRVWGLNPGAYYISAIARNPGVPGGRGFAPMGSGGPGAFVTRGRGAPGAADGRDDLEQEAYAPTYFPGVPSVNEARAVTIGLATEIAGIDFNVLLVRASRISGRVTNADGSAASAGSVNLIPEGGTGRNGGPLGGNYVSRIQDDGVFSIVNVPPGRYVLRARGDGPRIRGADASAGSGSSRASSRDDYVPPQFAVLPLTVNGDIGNLNVALALGATISGKVTFQATQSRQPPQVDRFRIIASLVDRSDGGPNSTARIEQDGTFLLVGVPAGSLWLRSQAPGGWSLKSAIVDGRETIDAPFEIGAGDKITGVDLTFIDRQSEISGTVTDAQGLAVTEYTVLAFPADSALWRPQARQIVTARPDQTGKFQLRGLPPGDYYVATIDPAEQGEWFEPAFLEQQRSGATRVSLGEGATRTQNFRVSSPR
jgi:Carboxypeptidase regulatory-like domain